jgi:hypothetical protein
VPSVTYYGFAQPFPAMLALPAADGRERGLRASYNAPAFGLLVYCQCEPVGSADDV